MMTRHRTRVRLARWLRAVVLGALASALPTALFEWDLGRGLELPLVLIAVAPPIVYLALALVVIGHAPASRWVSWAVAACGVNAAIGLGTSIALAVTHPLAFEEALMRAFGVFVPAPLIHLAAAPLVLLAFRSRVAPARPVTRGFGATGPSVPSLGLLRPAGAPNWDDVLRPTSVPAGAPGTGAAAFERARPWEAASPSAPAAPASQSAVSPAVGTPVAAARAAVTLAPAPSDAARPGAEATLVGPAPPTLALAASAAAPEMSPPTREEPMLRVAFDRLADQLPPDVFVLPPARLGESLREPHTLLVPQRLVVPQLGEGRVEIPWTLIEDQFPELALAIPRAEVRRRFPDWGLSLPMDEVVAQLPSDVFRVSAPAPDLSNIGLFPAPFRPDPPAPEPEADAGAARPFVTMEDTPLPRLSPAPAVPPAAPARSAAEPAPAAVVSPAVPAPITIAPPAAPAASAAIAAASPADPAARVVRAAPVATPSVGLPAPAAIRPANGVTPVPEEAADEALGALGRALAISLAPVGALEWRGWRIAGRPLVCFVAAALVREPIDALATRGTALLDHLATWSVDQITVRSSRVACVLTPLTAGGSLAAAVRRGGPVALLEIVAARARGVGRAPAPVVIPPPAAPVTPVAEANGRIGEAARALAVLGSVVPTEIAAEGAAPGVFVFAGRVDTALVSAARAVHDTLVTGHDDGGLGRLESVTLRRGRERVIVRPLRGVTGAPALLAAAGEMAMAARVQRSAARAATLLEAR